MSIFEVNVKVILYEDTPETATEAVSEHLRDIMHNKLVSDENWRAWKVSPGVEIECLHQTDDRDVCIICGEELRGVLQ